MSYPMEWGNYVLIILGIVLVLSGPYIIFRTVQGVLEKRRLDPTASLQLFSNLLNLVIAVLFFMAGILFVVNNLRGNPFAV